MGSHLADRTCGEETGHARTGTNADGARGRSCRGRSSRTALSRTVSRGRSSRTARSGRSRGVRRLRGGQRLVSRGRSSRTARSGQSRGVWRPVSRRTATGEQRRSRGGRWLRSLLADRLLVGRRPARSGRSRGVRRPVLRQTVTSEQRPVSRRMATPVSARGSTLLCLAEGLADRLLPIAGYGGEEESARAEAVISPRIARDSIAMTAGSTARSRGREAVVAGTKRTDGTIHCRTKLWSYFLSLL